MGRIYIIIEFLLFIERETWAILLGFSRRVCPLEDINAWHV